MKTLSKSQLEALEAAKTCDHPEDQRHRLGFGIYCGKCKILLSHITQEEMERLILEDLNNNFI